MITLGLAELAATAVLMFPSIFGGEEGINGDRSDGPALFGIDFGSQFHVYFLIAAWAFGCAFLMWRYTATPLGRLANAVRDNAERVGFIGYNPASVRYLVFVLSGLFAGVAGGLQALNDEIVTSANISSEASGGVLLMTFIGGVGTFWGPVLGAILVTFLQVALSTYTDAWQLYDGLLFIAAVVWAPGGLSGIILAHAPLVRAGRAGALLPAYAAQLPGLALAIGGVVFLAELAFRLQAVRNGAPAGRLLGMAAQPHAPWQWAIGVGLVLAGVLLLRRFWPAARGAWQAQVAAIQ
jgi:branched-chain amino acid transport system permease protein